MRRTALLVTMTLVVTACGSDPSPASRSADSGSITASTSPRVEGAGGDGVLDCADGQVGLDADVRRSADTERDVAAAALAPWNEPGGSLVEGGADDAWSIVVNGRDVAVAYPEIEGTGAWVVHGVRVCGEPEPETGPVLIDGDLDCLNAETEFTMQGSVPADATGPPTPEEELRMFLAQWADKHGGELVLTNNRTGSLVIDGREQVVAHASPAPAGGWIVLTTLFCERARL